MKNTTYSGHTNQVHTHIDVSHTSSPNGSKLPKEIENLTLLEVLNVAYCVLEALPSEIGKLQSLKTILCSQNQSLRVLPDEFYDLISLTYCDFNNCDILSFSDRIGNLVNLETFMVRR